MSKYIKIVFAAIRVFHLFKLPAEIPANIRLLAGAEVEKKWLAFGPDPQPQAHPPKVGPEVRTLNHPTPSGPKGKTPSGCPQCPTGCSFPPKNGRG